MKQPTTGGAKRADQHPDPAPAATVPSFSPEAALSLRQAAGWTQLQAAQQVHYGLAARWSEIERGVRQPSAAAWELAHIKAGQHPIYRQAPSMP